MRLTIAITAMGGQGGGVLADWLVGLAESQGWLAQTTSVPGVAQRTGATLYYVELFDLARAGGREPVLALMPVSGDVDLVVAAELMEAGRAIQRGIVTPQRTTLIASSHRAYAVAEKVAPGDGRADPAAVHAAARAAARRYLVADMAAIAEAHGSVISASLFGAVAASGVLPFGREAFEAAVRAGGVGVDASLAAFDAGYRRVLADADADADADGTAPAEAATGEAAPLIKEGAVPIAGDDPAWTQIRATLPPPAHEFAAHGVARLRDYQDDAYAASYLARLAALARRRSPAGQPALIAECARWLALWMAYEDVVRVADLKTRAERFARIRMQAGAEPGQPVAQVEFLHPRVEEIADVLPAALGRRLLASPAWRAIVARVLGGARRLDTARLPGFVAMRVLAGGRRWRRASLRFAQESAAIDAWLARVGAFAERDPALALEVARLPRLIKGYSDTHQRGRRRFEAVCALADANAGSADAAARVRAALAAALADADDATFDRALAR